MAIVIKNIDCLVSCRGGYPKKNEGLKEAGIIENGFIIIEEGLIKEIGKGEGYRKFLSEKDIVINGTSKTVTPGLIDCHTHLVYGGSREKELKLKLQKVSYIDILKKGGGILSTVEETRKLSFDQLLSESKKRLDLMLLSGTTTVESKSGYGLNFDDEIKMLKINKVLNDSHPIEVISTYLGAHAVPKEFMGNRKKYIELMIEEIIPYIARENLAEFIDCFSEEGVFTLEETKTLLNCGKKWGLKIKIHADEIKPLCGAELAAELNAVSADHLVGASDYGIRALGKKDVIAVLLPATSFYLMTGKFARARFIIESGTAVALATDCNPGTSPTESLQTVMTFACFGMGMLPEEIINALTINAACAINREKEIGSLEKGKKADVTIFNSKNLDYLIYHFGINAVETVIKDGKIVVEQGRVIY